jgi:hypothetical protein
MLLEVEGDVLLAVSMWRTYFKQLARPLCSVLPVVAAVRAREVRYADRVEDLLQAVG